MSDDEGFSVRRFSGLLCYALAAAMVIGIVMLAITRIYWYKSRHHDVDILVFGGMGIIALLAALTGYSLKPGSFSLRTFFVGMTFLIILMGEIAVLMRAD